MKTSFRFAFGRSFSIAALFVASTAFAQALPVGTPEPADYALGFGVLTVGFVVWRNFRKGRAKR